MPYARIALAHYRPGGFQAVTRRAPEALTVMRAQPGSLSSQLFQLGESTALPVSRWESRELAEQGYGRLLAWLREHLGDAHESIQPFEGEEVAHAIARGSGGAD